MKLSWILTALILAIGAYFYKHTERAQQANQTTVAALQRSIADLGLDPSAAAEGRVVSLAHSQQQVEETALAMETKLHDDDIRQFARELLDFALEMKRLEETGEPPPPELSKRLMECVARLAECDETDMRLILGEAKSSPALDDKTRRNLISGCCMLLSQNNPAASVKLLGEAREIIGDKNDGMLAASLRNWAKSDPQSALDWADRPENAGLVNPETKRGIILGVAQTDPQKALSMALAQGDEAGAAINGLPAAAPMSSWTSLLEKLGSDPSTSEGNLAQSYRKVMLDSIAKKLVDGTIETTAQWIASANLPENDLNRLMKTMSQSHVDASKRPAMLEWIGKTETDPTKLTEYTRNIIPSWTQQDFNGTGAWINQQPPGVMREAATQSFAETLAPHEPEAASVWALNLPASENRTKLLQKIRDSWKSKDPVASNVFATEHGLP